MHAKKLHVFAKLDLCCFAF